MVKAMAGCPAKIGFRMPAEWEPHEQCWMGWPVRTHPPLPPSLTPSRLACRVLRFRPSFFSLSRERLIPIEFASIVFRSSGSG